MSELRVVANSFGADYGRALGVVVNIVTKSGTNNFHGSLYDYFQNGALDARSLLQPAPAPDTRTKVKERRKEMDLWRG